MKLAFRSLAWWLQRSSTFRFGWGVISIFLSWATTTGATAAASWKWTMTSSLSSTWKKRATTFPGSFALNFVAQSAFVAASVFWIASISSRSLPACASVRSIAAPMIELRSFWMSARTWAISAAAMSVDFSTACAIFGSALAGAAVSRRRPGGSRAGSIPWPLGVRRAPQPRPSRGPRRRR